MLRFTHILTYIGLSTAYGAACFGFDKTLIQAFTAVMYLLLALDDLFNRHM